MAVMTVMPVLAVLVVGASNECIVYLLVSCLFVLLLLGTHHTHHTHIHTILHSVCDQPFPQLLLAIYALDFVLISLKLLYMLSQLQINGVLCPLFDVYVDLADDR